jgi:fumarate hydratase subunit beta
VKRGHHLFSDQSTVYDIRTPVDDYVIRKLKVGDMLKVSGTIYCGRDIVLPRIVQLYETEALQINHINLQGSLIFHSAVSCAGVGATSSNKLEIESSIAPLSKAGVKIHLGKGTISAQTVAALGQYNSIFAIIPPITASLESKIFSREVIAFPEFGMEAFYRLSVENVEMIVAAARGQSIYEHE